MSTEDDSEYDFLVFPGSALILSLGDPFEGRPQIMIQGNRRGMASLAGVLLWLYANTWREFLSLTGLSFVDNPNGLALTVRVSDDEAADDYGNVFRLDKGVQFEWAVSEDQLKALALAIHHLACLPEHDYQRVPMQTKGDAWVRFELTEHGGLEKWWKRNSPLPGLTPPSR